MKQCVSFNTDHVCQLVAEKLTRSEIAERLGVRPRSVTGIVKRAMAEHSGRSSDSDSRKEPRPWTDKEFQHALELKRTMTAAAIGRILGRSGEAVAQKISTYEQRQIRNSAGWLLDFTDVKVSEQQLAERNGRQEASYQRDTTALLMGDPPPGYSARDRRGM